MNYIRYSAQSGLTDSDIIDMRVEAAMKDTSPSVIGERYGIDRTTAARIISGRTWSHVPAPKTIGNYKIYPDGRIYSKSAGRFLQQTTTKDGSAFVELRANGEREKVSVASLVARAFLGTKSTRIGFINGDASDTHFTNLIVKR